MKCVLIADDSAVVRRTLQQMFEQSGWTVCAAASNGSEAVAKAKELGPDIVVLDLSMPTMNGLIAGRRLKEMFPRTPLILFTSFGNVLDASELHKAGFSALVDKNDAGRLVTTAETLLNAL